MSFLDRFAKGVKEAVDKAAEVVSEVVDDSKDAIDRMSSVNTLKGEIRDFEKLIEELQAQIQAVKVQLGEKAMGMLKAGTLDDPELHSFIEQVEGFEQQIAGHKEGIAEKEAAIEQIQVEAEEEKQAKAAAQEEAAQAKAEAKTAAEAEAKATAEAEAKAVAEAADQVAAAAPAVTGTVCPQCGEAMPEDAVFCPNCGGKTE